MQNKANVTSLHHSFTKADCKTENIWRCRKDTFYALFHFKMSDPVKHFQNDCICVGFGRAKPGTGTCSNCSAFIEILRLCSTVLLTCSCRCSCVCWGDVKPAAFLQLWQFLAVAAAARLRFPGGAHTGVGEKGGLVESTGSNVNIFYWYGMSRTMKMWLLYDYHSVGVQLLYFITCGYKTQKMQCNQMVHM